MNAYIFAASQTSIAKITDFINQKEDKPIASLVNNPDINLVQEEQSIKISTARALKQYLAKKPFQLVNQYVVIFDAHKLTIPAQNALLKTIEELHPHHYVIFVTPWPEQLLPTIRSRCQTVREKEPALPLPDDQQAQLDKLFAKLGKATHDQKLILIEPYTKNRPTALQFCQDMTLYLRSQLIQNPTNTTILLALKRLFVCQKQLQANCHVQLALDSWALGCLACKN